MLYPFAIPSDLWQAVKINQSGNPLLAALIYSYCPMAAFYYLGGVVPHSPPVDPHWKALEDISTGNKLLKFIQDYGFSSLLDEISKYRDNVVVYRRLNMTESPEIYPVFRGGRLTQDKRFGVGNAIIDFGGEANLFEYIRTWAFLIPDWLSVIHFNHNTAKFSQIQVDIRLKCASSVLKYPFWVVEDGYERVLFSLSPCDDEDWIRAGLLKIAGISMEFSRIYLFDPVYGKARVVKGLDLNDFEIFVENLLNTSKSGSYLPVNAIQRRYLCRACVFKPMCFIENEITPYALNFYENTKRQTITR